MNGSALVVAVSSHLASSAARILAPRASTICSRWMDRRRCTERLDDTLISISYAPHGTHFDYDEVCGIASDIFGKGRQCLPYEVAQTTRLANRRA